MKRIIVNKEVYFDLCKSFGMEPEVTILEKARKANIGEIRDWHGQKMKKVAEGKWLPVSEGRNPAKEDKKTYKVKKNNPAPKEEDKKTQQDEKSNSGPEAPAVSHKPGTKVSIKGKEDSGKFTVVKVDSDGTHHVSNGKENYKVPASKLGELNKEATYEKGEPVMFMYGGNDMVGTFLSEDDDSVKVKTSEGSIIDVPKSKLHYGPEAKKKLAEHNQKLDMFNTDKWDSAGKFKEGEKGLQPAKTPEEILKLAEKDHKPLVNMCNNIAKMFNLPEGNVVMRTKFKDVARATEKLEMDYKDDMDKYGKSDIKDKNGNIDYSSIRDWDGGTIVFQNMEGLNNCLEYLSKQNCVIRIKNNFSKKQGPKDSGYCDVNVNVRLPNGTVSEIQLNTPANMISKKSYGHSLYEISRSDKISNDPQYAELKENLLAGQKQIYDLSNKFSLEEKSFKVSGKGYFEPFSVEEFDNIALDVIQKNNKTIEEAFKAGAIDDKSYGHYKELVQRVFK